jgi:hypothetical protein
MSLVIDNLDDLRTFLKHTGVKVTNVEEMKALMAAINSNYNPDAARLRVARLMGLTVPSVTTGVAGFTSFFIVGGGPGGLRHEGLAALCVVWGVVALVSLGALLASAIMARGGRRPAPAAGAAPQSLKTYRTDSGPEAGPPLSRNIMLPEQYP